MAVGRLTVTVVVVIVLAMLLVPTWGLFHSPARFGWQMYASGKPPAEYVVVEPDGRRTPVDFDDFVANTRSEVAYERHLPPLLCERFPEASHVLVTRPEPPLDVRYRCDA